MPQGLARSMQGWNSELGIVEGFLAKAEVNLSSGLLAWRWPGGTMVGTSD